jgi:hypothetical protein
MTRFLTCIGLALVIGSFGNILNSNPLSAASGVCNNICKQKCSAAVSRGDYPTMTACEAVWAPRNGPTGRGCGKPGEPWKSCV